MTDAKHPRSDIASLENRLKQLEEEKEAIIKLLAIWKGQTTVTVSITNLAGSPTIRGRVIDAVIDLVHKNGRQVTNDEVLTYVEEKGLSLGTSKNKSSTLGAILDQESKKKSARIRKVTRGTWDIKQ